MQTERCENMNHRRTDAPVGHCPQCGRVVNERKHMANCSDAAHARARREMSVFCVHCGTRLITR